MGVSTLDFNNLLITQKKLAIYVITTRNSFNVHVLVSEYMLIDKPKLCGTL